ncbi:MAG: hypothetical protein KDA79_20370, partial [Planctomycetaceae bacterium]|nr:hypothetical protein [Planctomycetaceae bacterium]
GFNNQLPRLDFASSFKMAIVDVVGTYNLLHDSADGSALGLSRLDLLAGVRYWQLDGAVRTTGPLGVTRGRAGEKEWVDPIIGARAIMPLGEGVEAQIRGDVGGFDWGTASDFTWNIEALLAMQMTENVALRGGYRVLDVNNHRGSGREEFGFDMQFRGPVAELAIEF